MSDQTIGLPVDGIGKKLDTEELLVAATTVQRERNQIAGAADVEIARVLNTDPLSADYALIVRQAPPVSPSVDYVTSSALAAGASVDLDATTIAAATTGKLMRVDVGSSVPCKWVIKTRDGAVEVIKNVLYTSGLTGGQPTDHYIPASKDGVTLAGAGVDENFRVTVTNLGTQALEAADVHTTVEWDEV
jgi:hypothetical protein